MHEVASTATELSEIFAMLLATSQGPRAPLLASDGGGNDAWQFPQNISEPEDQYATCAVGNGHVSNYLIAKNFLFSIPATEIIGGQADQVRMHEIAERYTASRRESRSSQCFRVRFKHRVWDALISKSTGAGAAFF